MDRRLVLLLGILTSFCGLGYQQVLALTLSDALGDYVLSQSLTLGVFLFGMGLGTLGGGGSNRALRTLLTVEWCLSLCGTFAPAALHIAELGTHSLFLAIAVPTVFVIGFLTGFELPLLLQERTGLKPGTLLAANYVGAFAGAITVPMFLIPYLDVQGTAAALGICNFIAATLILAPLGSLKKATAHVLLGLALVGAVKGGEGIARLHLQAVYFGSSSFGSWLGDIVRIRTKYQWIDLVPPEFSERVQGRQDFQLYLDRKIQLSSSTIGRYHESMVQGSVNLLGRAPQRVLILGGGDGLLAHELLKQATTTSIDLVELDEEMIHLAREQRELKAMNGKSLSDPRVHVHIEDAFQFVRRTDQTYDLVLIDLPFPYSYELSLLFSKEFYQMVARHLLTDAVMITDFPLPSGRQDHLPVLLHTLRAAGFERPFGFGTEDFFVAVSPRAENLEFHYPQLMNQVSDQTLSNLISRPEDVATALSQKARVNSVFFPVHFRHLEGPSAPGTRPEQRISFATNPGFLNGFLARLETGMNEILQTPQPSWPFRFRQAWLEGLAEPRDLSEEIRPGLLWPRFQIGFAGHRPVFQWFDVKSPAKLREIWNSSQCVRDESDWTGVRWTSDLSVVEFFGVVGEEFEIRRYENRQLQSTRREKILEPVTLGIARTLRDERADGWRERLQSRFLILPRSITTTVDGELVLYP